MAKPDTRDPMVKAIEFISSRITADLPDHNTARQMQAEVNALKIKAEALDRVARTRNPLDTPAAHALKVAKMARTFNTETTAMINRAAKVWSDGLSNAKRRIDEKVNLTPDSFAGEIRAAFRTLPAKKQADLIKDLVAGNRGPELAAIVKAPSVLTGVTDAQRAAYEKMIYSTHAAAEMDEMAKLEDVWQSVAAVSRAAGSMVKELTDPGMIATIESQAAAADEAGAAFNQSMTPQ